ncbi:MAG: DUF1489 family protein [Sphingomonadaceae bacterium]
MSPAPDRLGLTRVAFGCRSLEELAAARDRFALTLADGSRVGRIGSARRPREADRLVGGRLFWIIRHTLVARQTILDVVDGPEGGCEIRLDLEIVPVEPRARRAHQGWRYLAPADWPPDAGSGGAALPPALAAELAALALL